jgi:hypothetical protein
MADLKVTQLSNLGAMPDAADLLMVVDVSDTTMSAGGTNKQVTANCLGRSFGAVIYAQDGKALTVPDSGTAATRQAVNTFTASQVIAPVAAGSTTILTLTPPTSHGANSCFTISTYDNGALNGPLIYIGRNNNASTPAAGTIRMTTIANIGRYFWVDAAGLWRVHTAAPTNATDTAGAVVGDQTSALVAKTVLKDMSNLDDVFQRVAAGADAVRRFVYNSGAYNSQEFEGVVVDYAPEYGKDKDADFPAGKALNEVTIVGDLLRAVANLATRVLLLEGIALDSETPEGSLTQAQREALASLGGSLLARYG